MKVEIIKSKTSEQKINTKASQEKCVNVICDDTFKKAFYNVMDDLKKLTIQISIKSIL